MSKGYVYILSNPSMPGIVKIGKTTRTIEARAQELYQTGVPTPFKIEHYVYSPDCLELEQLIHSGLEKWRVSLAREFFAIDIADAKTAVGQQHREQMIDWLDEFMPDHEIIPCDLCLDVGSVHLMAQEMQIHPYEVISAISELYAEEVVVGHERWKEACEQRRAARLARDAENG